METGNSRYRRPAMLDVERHEQLLAHYDESEMSELGWQAALAVVGVAEANVFKASGGWMQRVDIGKESEVVTRIRDLLGKADQVDLVAELWDNSPATTLGGLLWRIYILRQWLRRSPKEIEQTELQSAAELICGQVDGLFSGQSHCPISVLGEQAVWFLRELATRLGKYEWITEKTDELAYAVTTRTNALIATAEEITQALCLIQQERV